MTRKRRPSVIEAAAEDRAERLVPAIQRLPVVQLGPDKKVVAVLRPALAETAQWNDPEDQNERAKTPRQVMGYRRVDPLVASAAQGGPVTSDHVKAVNRYRDDYEIGCLGARPGHERPEVGTGAGYGAVAPSEAQMAALERYGLVTRAVGQRAGWVLVEIVLGVADIGEAGERRNLSKRAAIGYVVGVLDRMQEAYDNLDDQKPAKNRA